MYPGTDLISFDASPLPLATSPPTLKPSAIPKSILDDPILDSPPASPLPERSSSEKLVELACTKLPLRIILTVAAPVKSRGDIKSYTLTVIDEYGSQSNAFMFFSFALT